MLMLPSLSSHLPNFKVSASMLLHLSVAKEMKRLQASYHTALRLIQADCTCIPRRSWRSDDGSKEDLISISKLSMPKGVLSTNKGLGLDRAQSFNADGI